jgi:hypothetical protein
MGSSTTQIVTTQIYYATTIKPETDEVTLVGVTFANKGGGVERRVTIETLLLFDDDPTLHDSVSAALQRAKSKKKLIQGDVDEEARGGLARLTQIGSSLVVTASPLLVIQDLDLGERDDGFMGTQAARSFQAEYRQAVDCGETTYDHIHGILINSALDSVATDTKARGQMFARAEMDGVPIYVAPKQMSSVLVSYGDYRELLFVPTDLKYRLSELIRTGGKILKDPADLDPGPSVVSTIKAIETGYMPHRNKVYKRLNA